jgi:N utilization substance protein B
MMPKSNKKNKDKRLTKKGRSGSRQLLLQVLYQHQLNDDNFDVLLSQSKQTKEFARIDQEYFELLLEEILEDTDTLDKIAFKFADRSIEKLDPVERAILWIGLCEFSFHKDTPPVVVINEAIELAKIFGAQDSFQFINGVLDSFLQEQTA